MTLILTLFVVCFLNQVQSSPTGSQQVTATLSATSSLSSVATKTISLAVSGTGDVSCGSRDGNWSINPVVAQKLGARFCSKLSQKQVMPKMGDFHLVDIAEYPSDLGLISACENHGNRGNVTSETGLLNRTRHNADAGVNKFFPYSNVSGQAINTTLIEVDGAIVEFFFTRRATTRSPDAVTVHGSDEQCAMEYCSEIMYNAVDKCKHDSHYIKGSMGIISECGFYVFFVQNCSGNYVDPDCDEWHRRWPDVGPKENETLYWNVTHNITSKAKRLSKGSQGQVGGAGLDGMTKELNQRGVGVADLFQVMNWA